MKGDVNFELPAEQEDAEAGSEDAKGEEATEANHTSCGSCKVKNWQY